jgi:DNA-directed RNA polymerase subunit beta
MHVLRNYRLEETSDDDDDVDYELMSPSRQWGTHINTIPLQGAVQVPRLFYGARFANQALAIDNGEAALVQNLDPEDKHGRSFDEKFGAYVGARRAGKVGGVVEKLTPGSMKVRYDDGTRDEISLYRDMPFNQKSGITSRTKLKDGDRFAPGQLLAATNYTDDEGTLNMGLNARVGLVPYKGFSMDDALVVSQSFADRLRSTQYKTLKQDENENLKTDLNGFRSLFPTRFPKEVLVNFDSNGMVKPGTKLQPGDPVVLGTMPKTMSSAGVNVGKLSKQLRANRRDASLLWDGDYEAEVVDTRKTKNGYKVVVKYSAPSKEGDKVVFRQGAKGTISRVIPDDRMPRTKDDKPLEVLLNPLSLVSRANPATAHEIRLGKVAKAMGSPLKVPAYLPKGQDWGSYIADLERKAGVSAKETLFDPESNRELAAPVTVGYGFLMKLHHTSSSKNSSRGAGSYSVDQQPLKGGSDSAQAKRFSGLENAATLSSGAYALMRENSTLRGQRNDDYWRALRGGKPLPKVGEPFVWHKFRALLGGAGIQTRDLGKGRIRLAPFTDRDLDDKDPIDVENGELVDTRTMEPVPGGLFDSRIVTGDRWGRIKLPRPVINPAHEDAVRSLLGLTKKELDAILRGEAELPDKLRQRLGLATSA